MQDVLALTNCVVVLAHWVPLPAHFDAADQLMEISLFGFPKTGAVIWLLAK